VANLRLSPWRCFSLQVYDGVIPHQSEATLMGAPPPVQAFRAVDGGLLKMAAGRGCMTAGRRSKLSVQDV